MFDSRDPMSWYRIMTQFIDYMPPLTIQAFFCPSIFKDTSEKQLCRISQIMWFFCITREKKKKITHTWNVQFQVLGMVYCGCPWGACGNFSNSRFLDILNTSTLNVAFNIQSSIWASFFPQFPKPYAILFHVFWKMKKIVVIHPFSHYF